jgi:hypothetical protein
MQLTSPFLVTSLHVEHRVTLMGAIYDFVQPCELVSTFLLTSMPGICLLEQLPPSSWLKNAECPVQQWLS